MRYKNSNEIGQGIIEYSLILVMVSIVVAGSLSLFGNKIKEFYSTILCEIQNMDDCHIYVFLEEDFGDGSDDAAEEGPEYDFSDWETGLWRNKKRKWTLEDGKLVSEKDASILFDQVVDGAYSVLLSGVDLLNESNKSQSVSLHFNSSYEDNNFNGYALKIESGKKGDFIFFQEYANGRRVRPDLSKKVRLPSDFDWDNPADIQVDVQGDTFTGYVNGVAVVEAQDSTYSEGQVGIASGRNAEISVDAIQVQSIEDTGGE